MPVALVTSLPTRSAPRLLSLLAALALVVSLLVAAPPAHATPAKPTGLTLVSASRSALAVSWDAVPGASAYQVSYATATTMKGAKTKTSTKPYVELTKLTAKTTYYVTVTALEGKTKGAASKRLKAKTKASSTATTHLAPTGLAAGSVKATSVKLTWKSRASGARYKVFVSTKKSLANARVLYVTSPAKTVTKLEDGTTYYAAVQVVTSKNTARGDVSAPIRFSTPAVKATGGSATVKVVSYNVGTPKVSAKEGHPWPKRRTAVVAAVKAQKPDVIGFQEVSQGRLEDQKANISQAEQIVADLKSPYKLANTARYNCVDPKTPYRCKAKDQGAANSQKIVYNSTTLKLLKQGSKKTASTKTELAQHRYVEWAIFRHKVTGKEFFIANVHLDPGKTTAIQKIRKTQMDQILAVITKENAAKLPAYVVGDFNSHKLTEPSNVPYDMMVKAGFVDPLGNTYASKQEAPGAIVKKRINTEYSSHNAWQRTAIVKKGWINGIYIDYIWVSKGIEVPEWETVVKVDKDGRFTGVIPSDHNMLRATTVIP